MHTRNIPLSLRFILTFTGGGLVFSGYLTLVKLVSGTCAFNETCPPVFELPVCWYGFAFYVALLVLAIRTLLGRIDLAKGLLYISAVSFVGILFAGYLTLKAFSQFLLQSSGTHSLGVPTCFLGLICFMLTFVTAVLSWNHHREHNRQ